MTSRDIFVHSTYELVLTFVLLFGVTSFVRAIVGPSFISSAIPNIHPQLVVVGACVALLLTGLILSPLGRASGGHMNPAISLAMWRFGVFPGAGVLPYMTAQFIGSLLGVLAARYAWGVVVALPPVQYAVLQPAAGWSAAELFIAEAASMGVVVLSMGEGLSSVRFGRYVPWIVGGLIGLAIAILGTSTGGSLNPAREFGPAMASGRKDFLWVYLVAPLVGALAAVWARAWLQRSELRTHRLCGVSRSTPAENVG